jgi:hypothetical protein
MKIFISFFVIFSILFGVSNAQGLNPDKRASITISGGRSSLTGNRNSFMDEFYWDYNGNLQFRTVRTIQDINSINFHLGGSLLIPATDNMSIIINFAYLSDKIAAPDNIQFYGFEEDRTGVSFGAAIKIYISK